MTCGRSRVGLLAIATLAVVVWAGQADAYAFLLVEGGGGTSRRWGGANLADLRIPWFVTTAVDDRLTGERSLADLARAAFAHWEDLDESSVTFSFRGATSQRTRNASDGRNLIAFADASTLGTGVLGATFVTTRDDGEIIDADIVLSLGVDFSSRRDAFADTFDAESVLTHEVGHLIGLDHSGLVRATMAPFTDRGDVHQRTLEMDDAIGAGLLYPDGAFPAGRGSLAGTVSLEGEPVFLAHVVATEIHGRVAASAYTLPDGSYRIDGLPPDVYVVHAERLDGPVRPSNVAAFREGFGRAETMDYETTFH